MTRRQPRRCQIVGVAGEQVRRAGAAVAAGHHPKVDLDAVPRGEAVATSWVRTDDEAEPPAVRHRRAEVTDGKDRRYPLPAAHGESLA